MESMGNALQGIRERMEANKEFSRKREEEYYESGFIQLPLWPEEKRGSPNSFLRSALFAAIHSKDREYFEKVELFSQHGITVTYTGKQLNQEDLTVWLALVDLMKKDLIGTQCQFSAHSILKHLDLGTGGSAHDRLNDSIQRMTACLVKIETEKYIFGGSLIDGFVIDKDTKHYKVALNRHLIKLFGKDDWTAVNWEQRKRLRNKPLALFLHEYYASHEKPLSVSIEFLMNITGSMNKEKRGFKRLAKAALEELVATEFLKRFEIEGNMVTVERVLKPQKF
jgi:TrfA protein